MSDVARREAHVEELEKRVRELEIERMFEGATDPYYLHRYRIREDKAASARLDELRRIVREHGHGRRISSWLRLWVHRLLAVLTFRGWVTCLVCDRRFGWCNSVGAPHIFDDRHTSVLLVCQNCTRTLSRYPVARQWCSIGPMERTSPRPTCRRKRFSSGFWSGEEVRVRYGQP